MGFFSPSQTTFGLWVQAPDCREHIFPSLASFHVRSCQMLDFKVLLMTYKNLSISLSLPLSLSLFPSPSLAFSSFSSLSLRLLSAGPSAVLGPLSLSRLSVPHPDVWSGSSSPRRFSLSSSLPLSPYYHLSLSLCVFLCLSSLCECCCPLLCLCGLSSFQISMVERRSCGSGPT